MAASTEPIAEYPLDTFTLLGLAGALFTVVGLMEIGVQLFPLGMGSPEWEFGTYSSVMDTMPLLFMGMGLLGVFAIARGHAVLAKLLSVGFFLLVLFILAFAFLYATNVPQALRVNPRSPLQTGIKKAVTKASLQTAVYPIALLWLGVFTWRNSRRERR